jgi:thiol-disulfide isomerase/thioredoxin
MIQKVKFRGFIVLFLLLTLILNDAKAYDFPNIHAHNLLEGQQGITLNQLNTPLVLVSFWASWCGICKEEMNDLFKIVDHFDGKVSLMTVSTDDAKHDALKVYKIFKEKYTLIKNPDIYWLWDENKTVSLKKLNISRVPETYILRKTQNGYKVLNKVIGRYNWSSLKTYQKIESYLNIYP